MPVATSAAATSLPGGRVEVAPKAYRTARPMIQPSSTDDSTAPMVSDPDRKATTEVAVTTTKASGEIHLRPTMSATVSRASKRHQRDVERVGRAVAERPGERTLQPVERAGEDQPGEHEHEHRAQQRGAERLHELQGAAPDDEVGAHRDRAARRCPGRPAGSAG